MTGNPTPKEESPETYFDYTGKLNWTRISSKLMVTCYFCKDPKWQQSEATNQFLKRPMQQGSFGLRAPEATNQIQINQCADGLKQSPIDFKTFVVTNYTKFTFKKYNRIFPESLKNTGHSCLISHRLRHLINWVIIFHFWNSWIENRQWWRRRRRFAIHFWRRSHRSLQFCSTSFSLGQRFIGEWTFYQRNKVWKSFTCNVCKSINSYVIW